MRKEWELVIEVHGGVVTDVYWKNKKTGKRIDTQYTLIDHDTE